MWNIEKKIGMKSDGNRIIPFAISVECVSYYIIKSWSYDDIFNLFKGYACPKGIPQTPTQTQCSHAHKDINIWTHKEI